MQRLIQFVAIVGFILFATAAAAQTPVTGQERLRWEQPAPSLAVAQGYQYNFRIDTDPPVPAVAVQCIEPAIASGFPCSAAFPAATPGVVHGVTATASETLNGTTFTSQPSNVFSFRLVVVPATPVNLRLALAGNPEAVTALLASLSQ